MVAIRVDNLSLAVFAAIGIDLTGVVAAVEVGDPALFDSHTIYISNKMAGKTGTDSIDIYPWVMIIV